MSSSSLQPRWNFNAKTQLAFGRGAHFRIGAAKVKGRKSSGSRHQDRAGEAGLDHMKTTLRHSEDALDGDAVELEQVLQCAGRLLEFVVGGRIKSARDNSVRTGTELENHPRRTDGI